jgi:phosphoribosylaminoimidazole (AIR) synthetase
LTNGEVSEEEMFCTFNMGLGMLVIIPHDQGVAGACVEVRW